MSNDNSLTALELRSSLHYQPDTGVFTWKQTRKTSMIGTVAGAIKGSGYVRIQLHGLSHAAHRLAWLYVHGEWPHDIIDHINNGPADNRIDNLRVVPGMSANEQNITLPRSDNACGYRGVHDHMGSGRWMAQIKVNGVNRYLGLFDTPELASAAYIAAKRELHPWWVDPNRIAV